jgi:hypothetical protein
MAKERSDDVAATPDKAPSPAPLPEQARAAAEEAAKGMRGRITRGQEATGDDHAVPPHSPDATEGDASGEKGRGKSLGKFWAAVEELRQRLPDLDMTVPCRDHGLEPGD